MKILITGGAGFIGSHLADKLIEKKHNVVIVDNLSTGKKENINPKAKFYKTDIGDKKIAWIFKKENPEIVFHLAAQINLRESVKNPIEDAKINILGGLNILENCKKFNVKKIIFSSTGGAIYGQASIVPTPESYIAEPLSPYGIAKLATEKYLNYYNKVFGMPFLVLRFANVYGPRQNSKGEAGVIAIFCSQFFSNKQPIINGDGFQTRDFVYVFDVVKAILSAMDSEKTGVFNVGTAKETNINDIFLMIKKSTGSVLEEAHRPSEKGEQQRSCLDYSKIKSELNWMPEYDLKTGIEKTVEWFKNNKK